MKKFLSLLLAAILVLTAAIVPVCAKAIDYYSGKEMITIKTSSGKTVLQEPSTSHAEEILYYRQSVENPQYIASRRVTSETVIKPTDKITIKNISGNNLSFTIHVTPYTYTGEFYASGMPDAGTEINPSYYLLDDGSFGAIYAGYLDGFDLKNGQSKSFDFNKFIGTDGVEHKITEGAYFAVRVSVVNSDSDFYDYSEFEYMIKRTGDLTPVTPEEPEKELSYDPSDMLSVDPEIIYNSDDGFIYNFTVTNTTEEKMSGYYAVLSYIPQKYKTYSGEEDFLAEIHIFKADLAAGKSMSNQLVSTHNMSIAKNSWVAFENKAELDSIIRQNGIDEIYSAYSDKYYFHGDAGEALLKNTFGVTFTPAK